MSGVWRVLWGRGKVRVCSVYDRIRTADLSGKMCTFLYMKAGKLHRNQTKVAHKMRRTKQWQ